MKTPIKAIFLVLLSASLVANDGRQNNGIKSLETNQEENSAPIQSGTVNFDLKADFKESFVFMFKGAYRQFKQPSSLILLGLGSLALWPIFNADRKISERQSPPNDFTHKVGDEVANFFNFPLVPAGAYIFARYTNSLKWKKFAQETFAATYLALVETSLLSHIHIHDRPDSSNLTKFETSFRGDSSFPSGHVTGLAVLTMKSMQFFGPLAAIIPGFFTFVTHKERIQSRKHWASDTIGGFIVAAMASEGVRAASKYGNNHPFYKAIFEHQLKFSFRSSDDGWMGKIAFNF